MKNKIKIFLAALVIAGGIQAQTVHYLTSIFSFNYSNSTYGVLSQSISQTNNDSAYFANVGHVGTISDSLGDSTFFLYNLSPTAGGSISMGIQPDVKSDTLCDSIIVLENHIILQRYKIPNGPLSFGFTLTPSSNAGVSRPEEFCVKTKWKVKSGKGSHTMRIRPNFILN